MKNCPFCDMGVEMNKEMNGKESQVWKEHLAGHPEKVVDFGMTTEQFDKQRWWVDMKCIYDEKERGIASVDFKERLVGLSFELDDEIQWVRCESIKLIK